MSKKLHFTVEYFDGDKRKWKGDIDCPLTEDSDSKLDTAHMGSCLRSLYKYILKKIGYNKMVVLGMFTAWPEANSKEK